MRHKRPQTPPIPVKYRRYRLGEWPGGWAQWISEREAWNAAQSPVRRAGSNQAGLFWDYWCGPLGDSTDEMRARREARMLAATGDTET